MIASVLLFACVQAEPDHPVNAYPKDSPSVYSKNVVAGTTARANWIIINSDNTSSFNVRTSIVGDTGTWNVTLTPATFMISPNSIVELNLFYKSISANMGESKTIEIEIDYTQITSVGVPIAYKETEKVSYVVIALAQTQVHGMDITIWGSNIYHLDLPDYMDNNIGRFILSVVLWIIVAVITIAIILPVAKLFTSKTKTKFDDIALGIIRNPIVYAIVLYGVVDSLSQLGIPRELQGWVFKGISILIILMISYVIYQIFKRVIIAWMVDKAKKTESKLDDVLVPLLDKLGTVAIIIVTVIYMLSYTGINVTVLVAGMGMAGLVIGLAAQDTLSNFFAGIHLLIDRPFEIDDTIMLDNGDYCQVRHVGLRSTRLYNMFTDNEVSLTNNKIANMQINNVSKPDRKELFKVEVGVAYGSDLDKTERILLEIAEKHPEVYMDKDTKPYIRLTSFLDSSVNYALWMKAKDFKFRWRAASEIRREIYVRFHKEGIEIPYPQRVVHLKKEQ